MSSGRDAKTKIDRTSRVNDLLRRSLADLLTQLALDHGLGLVTVLKVCASKDLSLAKVYVSVLDQMAADKTFELMSWLSQNATKLRFMLAQRVKLRVMPKLLFYYDDTLEYSSKMTNLLDQISSD